MARTISGATSPEWTSDKSVWEMLCDSEKEVVRKYKQKKGIKD